MMTGTFTTGFFAQSATAPSCHAASFSSACPAETRTGRTAFAMMNLVMGIALAISIFVLLLGLILNIRRVLVVVSSCVLMLHRYLNKVFLTQRSVAPDGCCQ